MFARRISGMYDWNSNFASVPLVCPYGRTLYLTSSPQWACSGPKLVKIKFMVPLMPCACPMWKWHCACRMEQRDITVLYQLALLRNKCPTWWKGTKKVCKVPLARQHMVLQNMPPKVTYATNRVIKNAKIASLCTIVVKCTSSCWTTTQKLQSRQSCDQCSYLILYIESTRSIDIFVTKKLSRVQLG